MTPNKNTQTLALDDVAVGMALAESVLGEQGEVVLTQGVTLTEALIKALRRRGIETLLVYGEGPQPDAAAEHQLRLARLARLFRHVDGHTGTAHLQALLTQYRTQATA